MNAHRNMPELRKTIVRDLTGEECRRLSVHHHGGSLSTERRKAYLLKGAGDKWRAYFTSDEANAILDWIDNESPGQSGK